MSPMLSKHSPEEKLGKMDLKNLDVGKIGNFVLDSCEPRLNYYVKGGHTIMGDRFELLGFKDEYPVVKSKSHFNLNELNIRQNLKFKSCSKGESGEKIINLKDGKTLKVVPISDNFRKQSLCLNMAINSTKSPPKSLVNDNISINKNKDPLIAVTPPPLIKLEPADPNIKDNIRTFKLITVQKPTTVSSSLKTSPDDFVNPPDLEESLLGGNNNPIKLLSVRNLAILSEAKMQALNLSMKEKATKVSVGVQTELVVDNKQFKEQTVQTDETQSNKSSFESYVNLFDLEGFGDSPVLNDVNFGMGPTLPVSSVSFSVQTSNNMGHCIDENVPNPSEDISMKKRLLFFTDLRECLTYNIEGNLPIHEGVINNSLPFVQRHCLALKIRKQSVNLENHNGLNPLQLAIIHNVDIQIVQKLLNAGANIKETDTDGNNIFHLLAQLQRLNMLEVVLAYCKANNLFDYANSYNFDGLTPLMICCESSWTLGAQRFIKAGVKVNLKDHTSGRTALFHAAEVQNVEIVKLLLENKADPKIKNFFGTSPHDAMYELEDMHERIKSMIFGKSKKRSHEAELNPTRTAKAARNLKTFSRLHRIDSQTMVDGGIPSSKVKHKIEHQIK